MEKYKEKIEEVLTQALTEKTFSLEIIEKIKSLRDGFIQNENIIKQQIIKIEELSKQNSEITSYNIKLQNIVESYETREKDLEQKEKKSDKVLYELDFQKKRADEIRELFQIVFKNPVVRETAYKNASGFNGSGHSTSENMNGSSTKEVE